MGYGRYSYLAYPIGNLSPISGDPVPSPYVAPLNKYHSLICEAIQEAHPLLWMSHLDSFDDPEQYADCLKFLQNYLTLRGIPRLAAYETASVVMRDHKRNNYATKG